MTFHTSFMLFHTSFMLFHTFFMFCKTENFNTPTTQFYWFL
jgi:hypothetical protein